jgi:hypothetical protein
MTAAPLEVGKRYLLRRLYSRHPEEHMIQELAPSGRRFKSGDVWQDWTDYVFVEELPPLPGREKL